MAEIDDLFVTLRAVTAPIIDGFIATGVAGEEMAVKVLASTATITEATERMALANNMFAGSADEMALQAQIDYDRMAASAAAASAKMEAAAASAAAANERVGVAMAASTGRFDIVKKGVTAGAAAFDIFAVAAIHMAGDFESSTTRLVTSAGEIQSNLDAVRKGMLDMAGQVGDSAEELSRAMYTIESGGQHGADGLIVLRAAAEGAKAENADLTVVADAITSALQDYHLKASDAAMVTTKLVAAVGAGKTTFQELAGSLHSVLPLASSLHIPLDDIGAALASMTVHGMHADQAAQNLNDTIRHMTASTGVQVQELGQLGISVGGLSDMLGTKGITGTLQYLSEEIMQHMGPSGRVLLDAFNKSKDAANDATIMISKMPKALQDVAHAYLAGTLTLGEWRTTLKSLPADQANLLAQWKALQDRAGGFNAVLKSGAPAAQTYQDALRRVTGDATGLSTALMLTGENTTYVQGALKQISGATTEAGNHVKGWSEIQGTFNQRMSDAKAGLSALGITMGEQLLPAASKLMGWLSGAAQFLARHQTLAKDLAIAIGILAVAFTAATVAMWAMSTTPVFWIIAGITVAVLLLIMGIVELAKHWHQIWGAIWGFMKSIGEWFANDFAGFFVSAWNGIWGFLKGVGKGFEDVWNGVIGFLEGAIKWFQELPGRIGRFLSALPGLLKHWATEGMHAFFFAIGFGIGMIVKEMFALPGQIGHILTAVFTGGKKIVMDGVHAIADFFSWLWRESVKTVSSWWTSVVNGIRDGIVAALEWVSSLPGKVVHWFEDMRHKAVQKASEMVEGSIAFMRAMPGKALDALATLPGKIWEAVKDAGRWLWDAGKAVVDGFMNGLKSVWDSVVSTVKGWGRDIVKGFKSAIGMGSPSKRFAEAGKSIVDGLVQGLDEHGHQAVAAVNRLANNMTMTPNLSVTARGSYTGPISAGLATAAVNSVATAGGAGGGGATVVPVYIDGRKVFEAIVPYAQRNKNRNNSSFLT